MNVAVTSTGETLDATVDPRFGRCPVFLIVETDDLSFKVIENPNLALGGGAGIQSAQFIAEQGAKAVLTGNCGPNAHQTLMAAGVDVVIGCSGTVRDVVKQYKAGQLSPANAPNVDSKFGMGGGGRGMGMGGGRGMGMGGGRGMGMGGGGGRGMGMGGAAFAGGQAPQGGPAPQDELSMLKQQADALAQQMQSIQNRIEELKQQGDRD